jgi:hypothetical protein
LGAEWGDCGEDAENCEDGTDEVAKHGARGEKVRKRESFLTTDGTDEHGFLGEDCAVAWD